ncbi:hypothetical protein HK105_201219 [Polyrhizophydium stewartii]|uniref:Uncharacterized protein n=1 Tax=Polyrhizophydium stewartii TaxID=2732419 RepID=A0ABR4NHF9_9FUNG
MSRAAASSDDGEAGVPLIIRASTVSQDSHCPGGSVPGTSPLAGADAVEKGGATPRGTSSAAPRASPLEVLERIEALVQTLRECRTLIAQDSVDPDYAMEPQWVERVQVSLLQDLEGLIEAAAVAPRQQRERILAKLAGVQARVQALETELDERQDAGVARSLDQLPPAERTQRLLAWTDSLESSIQGITGADMAARASALQSILDFKAERRGYLRNTLGRIVLAVEGIPSSRVPPNVTELLATYTLERLADSPEDETLVLSDALVHTLDAAITQMDAHLEQLAQKLSSVTTEIVAFWEELRIDESLRTVLVADLRNLDDYCELCEALRLEWVAQMKAHVDELVGEVKDMWDRCRVGEPSRSKFMATIAEQMYSPLTVARLQSELRVLAVRLEKCHGINRLIEQRQDLLAKMHDFERTASDPRRLFRPSFQLVEEERFRKTCLPSLMKIEADIVDAVKHLEQETGEPFCEGDARYIDKLEAEIAQRFINATVFVLGRTSQPSRPTSASATPSMPTPTPASRQEHCEPERRDDAPATNAAIVDAASPATAFSHGDAVREPTRHWILAAKTITKGFSAVGRVSSANIGAKVQTTTVGTPTKPPVLAPAARQAVDSAHKPTPAPKTLARQKSLSRLRSTPSLKQGGQAPT